LEIRDFRIAVGQERPILSIGSAAAAMGEKKFDPRPRADQERHFAVSGSCRNGCKETSRSRSEFRPYQRCTALLRHSAVARIQSLFSSAEIGFADG
jgi:hypothetical protein